MLSLSLATYMSGTISLTHALLASWVKLISHFAFTTIASIIVNTFSILTKTRQVPTLVHICNVQRNSVTWKGIFDLN